MSAQVCGAGFAHTHGPEQLPTGRFMSQTYTFQGNAAPTRCTRDQAVFPRETAPHPTQVLAIGASLEKGVT